jgi:cytidylate kinase
MSEARRPVIALDGPGSSGKSTVGAAVAARLGLRFCDTGLLYRAMTYLAMQRGVPAEDEAVLVALVPAIRLEADAAGRLVTVLVDGIDVTSAVQGPEVDAAVSAYARVPALRSALRVREQAIAAAGGIVMAGRDIGTVVLPDATVKIYLDASVEERAARRAAERSLAAGSPDAVRILDALRARDELDSTRPVAPLRPAPDAIRVHTDGNALETTIDAVVAAIRGALPPQGDEPGLASGSEKASAPATRPAPQRPVRHRPPVAPTPVGVRMQPMASFLSFITRCVLRFFTRVRIEGDVAAIPRTGAVLMAANHASNADPILIGAFLNQRIGRPINWMGKREVFDWPFISWLARQASVHPVERGAADVEAFRMATRILETGNVLAVFPEGTRSPDGRLQAAKEGVAVLAARSGATVIPIGVADTDRLWPKGQLLPRFTRSVTLTVGAPLQMTEPPAPGQAASEGAPEGAPDGVSTRPGRRAKAASTERIMRAIAQLLPERQRGVYGDPSGT